MKGRVLTLAKSVNDWFSPYDDPLERMRSWVLVPVMILSVLVAMVNGLMIWMIHGIILPLCALIAPFVVVLLWLLRKGRGPARVGFLYGLYMEFLFIQAYLLVHTDVALLWLALVPLVAVFTAGTRPALWLALPPFLPTVLLHICFAIFPPGSLPFAPFLRPRPWYDEVSFSASIFVLLFIAISVEAYSRRLYNSWLHEQREVEIEMGRREAKEAELESSLSVLETLFMAIPIPVFVKDREMRYTRCSAAFCDCVGRSPHEVIGRRTDEIYSEGYSMLHVEADAFLFETGCVQCYSVKLTGNDGAMRDVLFLKTPIRAPSGEVVGLIGVMVDETERRKIERQLESQLESRRSALSLLAHDLRNPIGSFRSLVHSLREDAELDPREINLVLLELEKSLDSLWGLVQDLLEWAKSDAGLEDFKPELHNLAGICNQELPFFNRSASQKGLSLIWDVDPALDIYGDKRMIATVLRNFVGNAIKFTAEGSVSVLAKAVSLVSGADRPGVWIEVRDTGIGMQDQYLRNLVSDSAITSRRGTSGEPGTGLGIPLCRRMAERHGGNIRIESLEGKGSTFSVFFPEGPSHEGPGPVSSPDAV